MGIIAPSPHVVVRHLNGSIPMQVKSAILASVALSMLVALPTTAMAKKIKPGQYDLAGVIDVCLVHDGSWYYTTFAGNIGGWQAQGDKDAQIIMWGSYNSGVGQDSITVSKKNLVNWMEFHNDATLVVYFDQQPFTFVKTDCDPPPAGRNHKSNPAD